MFNETLRIERIARTQGGRYYCKAENGVGVPAIKSIRVDVQCELRRPRATGDRGGGEVGPRKGAPSWSKMIKSFTLGAGRGSCSASIGYFFHGLV